MYYVEVRISNDMNDEVIADTRLAFNSLEQAEKVAFVAQEAAYSKVAGDNREE